MYEIGKRIRLARERRGYSQKKFAELIGERNTTVSNWEMGRTRPDADTIAVICRCLDVSADDLLDIVFERMAVTPKERELVCNYRSSPHMQAAVDAILKIEQK